MEKTGEPRKILIVDDVPMTRSILRMMLEREESAIVIEADCGAALTALLEEQTPDMVFLDIKLPDADGLEILSMLKTRYPRVPVAMISANDSAMKMREAIRRGAIGYVLKPLSEKSAVDTVRNILRKHA